MYRKNTASQYIYFVLVNASSGAALTGATVTAYRALDGGSQASATGTTTELANGQYRFNLSQADTNADYGSYLFTATSAVPVEKTVVFTGANVTQVAFGANTTTPPTAGAIADAVLEESILDHKNVAHSLAKYIYQIKQATLTIDGVVSSAITPTTLTFSSNVSATTSAYAHAVLLFVSGPLTGENSPIVSYNNTNGVFVLEEPLTATPSDGDEFVVIAGSHVHAIAEIQSGLATSSGVTAAFTEIKGAGWSSSTDTLEEIRDASGATTVNVAPLQATAPNRVSGTEVVTYVNDTSDIGPIAVTDADGDPVNLSALTLKVCIEKIDGTILANLTPTVSGGSNNQVTFTPNADSVAKTGTFRWSLRRTSNNQVYALGDFVVDPAARIS
jgi:hypothetical protein